LESALLFEEVGPPHFRQEGSGPHTHRICGTHCLDFSNILVPNVLESQLFSPSQNNVQLGNKNTVVSNWVGDHCTFVPCQRTRSSQCLFFPLKLVLPLWSERYLHIRSRGFPWLPCFSRILFLRKSFWASPPQYAPGGTTPSSSRSRGLFPSCYTSHPLF